MIAEINGLSVPASGRAEGALSHASPIPENGWPLRPFQIVSLLDLKKYILVSLQNLAMIGVGLFDNPLGGTVAALDVDKDQPITPEHAAKFGEALGKWERHLMYLELKQSLKYVATLRKDLAKPDCKYGDYEREVDILQGRIDDEMEDIVFGFIPASHAQYFQHKELFGADINVKFPSTVKDIQEAGNCYAHGNYTASVFHLMRVLEIALHVLAKSLGVSFPAAIELENWKNIIDKIDSAIRALEQLPKSTQKSEDLQFYSEAAKEFRYFKDAWRNHVAHAREEYDIHDATKIMEHTKEFMQHLATRLKE